MKQKMQLVVKKIKGAANINNGVLLVAVLIAAACIWSTIEAIQNNFSLQQKVDTLTQEVTINELENKTLELQKAYYNSDQYLELSARERLNLANPGEKLLILPANTVAAVAETADLSSQTTEDRSNISQWLYFLFGHKE